jgi:hypothetical protein
MSCKNREPVLLIAATNPPGNYQLGIAIEGGLCPSIASASGRGLGEAPNFIRTGRAGGDVAELVIMEGRTGRPGTDQQLSDGN